MKDRYKHPSPGDQFVNKTISSNEGKSNIQRYIQPLKGHIYPVERYEATIVAVKARSPEVAAVIAELYGNETDQIVSPVPPEALRQFGGDAGNVYKCIPQREPSDFLMTTVKIAGKKREK